MAPLVLTALMQIRPVTVPLQTHTQSLAQRVR